MNRDLRAKLEALGTALTPDLIAGTQQIFVGLNKGMSEETKVERDISYGPDDRNRLDLFTQGSPHGAPVLVYVHGGGFVMGDKHSEGSPFYSNMGDFAARLGMIGVTMTYRLAPDNQFPSGPDDMQAAVEWLRANVAEYGGDPDKIVLCGQSAGATHVAGYIAHRRDHAACLAGAIFMSGIYDTTTCEPNHFAESYYGKDRNGWGPASCMAGLLASDVPMQFSAAEFDPDDFHRQAAQLVEQWTQTKGRLPEMQYLSGHNHLSPASSIGSPHDEIERMVAGFISRVAS